MSEVNGYSVEKSLGSNGAQSIFNIRKMSGSGYSFNVTLTGSPTGNCQLASFGLLNYMLKNIESMADLHAVIKECFRLHDFTPLLILVDVKTEWIPYVEKNFTIVTKSPYISTNHSNMCLFVVKIVPPEIK